MWVSAVRVRNFRSYADFCLHLEPGINVFTAPNGWGKTNLIEAIAYFARLRSHRVSGDFSLVKHGEEVAFIAVEAHRGPRSLRAEMRIPARAANQGRVNRTNLKPQDMYGIVPAVVFAPEDLDLVKGDPGERRAFIDDVLAALNPRFAGVKADFDRALKQRNALLKRLRNQRSEGLLETLDIWDHAFAEAATQLSNGRIRVLAELEPLVRNRFSVLAAGAQKHRASASLHYSSTLLDSGAGADPQAPNLSVADVVAVLREKRRLESERGISLVGPQRDDLYLGIGETPAKGYASQGESWSLALALRLATWDLVRAREGDSDAQPILILDDVFAELDADRRERLAQAIAPAEQVLITAAVPADLPAGLGGRKLNLAEYDGGQS